MTHSRSRAPVIALIALVALGMGLSPGLARADDPPPPYSQPPPYPPPPGPGYGPPGYAPQPGMAVSGPEEITDFDDSAPTPYGYTRVQRTRKGLIIAGAVTRAATSPATAFIVAVAAAFLKAEGSNTSVGPLFLPVVGPFLEIGETDSAI